MVQIEWCTMVLRVEDEGVDLRGHPFFEAIA